MRFKSRSRALIGSALAASLGLAGLALTASPAMAVEDTEVTRVEGLPTYPGGTRYETAAESATTAYPAGAANVVLASGEKFPDALAGGGLAGQLDAPILLSQLDRIPPSTIQALDDLGAETVTILGGVEAVSAGVEAELQTLGYTTDRVFGDDRFATAAAIAEEVGGDTAVLANGLRFPDALAISPGAHALELPVLLTTVAELHPDAAAYLDDPAVTTVIIVGGTEVVGQGIEDELEADGKIVRRLDGDTRYETAVEIAEFHLEVGFTLDELVMATGENFADALTGGPLAAQLGNPLVLTQTETLTPATATFIAENCAEIDGLVIMGGVLAISQAVEDEAAAAAQCSGNQTFTVTPQDSETLTFVENDDTTTNDGDPSDDREFTVSGLEAGAEYCIELFDANNVTVDDEGVVSFAVFDETADTLTADPGDVAADITFIETDDTTTVTGGLSQVCDIVASADGTITFVIDGEAAESVIPVVYADDDGNEALNVDEDGVPTELFGIGGVTVYEAESTA